MQANCHGETTHMYGMQASMIMSALFNCLTSMLPSADEVNAAAIDEEQQAILLMPTDNDDVTEVLQMLEQELAAYEEQELAAVGAARGRGRGGRGRAGAIRSTRLEMEDLVDLAQETALARCVAGGLNSSMLLHCG